MSGTISSGISATKLLAIGAGIALLVLTIGGAVAERIEQRAAGDRLYLGELSYGDSASTLRAGPQS